MNGTCKYAAVGCLLLFIASAGFAQMYTVTDITPPGTASEAYAINNRGQVVGNDYVLGAFRTAPNSPMNPATDLIGAGKWAIDINDLGQVVGYIWSGSYSTRLAFSTAPNGLIPVPVGGAGTSAVAINASGQAVVYLFSPGGSYSFRTAPNAPVNAVTDDLGALPPEGHTQAFGLNNAGQVVGAAGSPWHAFRTAPNKPINPATDDLGTLGGSSSVATSINAFGQVVGVSDMAGAFVFPHAFRTAPNRPINPVTDDLGTGAANDINDYGEVVGQSSPGGCFDFVCYDPFGHYWPFLYSSGHRQDLNELIPPVGPNCELSDALDINNGGQMAANVICDLDDGSFKFRAVLLTPIYKASVQPPIKADGSSVFPARTGVVQVKFNLSKNQGRTCTLPPATIGVTKAAGGVIALQANNSVNNAANNTYMPLVEKGPNFRISSCQYVYNLGVFSFSPGTYRIDISIKNIFVGHAVFTLK